MHHRRLAAPAIAAVLGLGACATEEPPAAPSWQVDVMPILAASCVRCHGYPTTGAAPFGLRLDSYENLEVAGFEGAFDGAAVTATTIARLTRPAARTPGGLAMPPGRALDDYEVTVLRNWAGLVDGALKAPRGPGRPDNAPPALVLSEGARDGARATFTFELRDADRDLVVGTVRGPRLGAQGQVEDGVIGDLVAGRGGFVVDLTGVPAGSYPLTARLDDGADLDGPDGEVDYLEVPVGVVEVAP